MMSEILVPFASYEEVIKKAKEMDLNVSKTCENCLKQATKVLERTFKQNKGGIGTVGSVWWGRGDLNPGPRTPQARILDQTGPRPLNSFQLLSPRHVYGIAVEFW